MKGFLYGVGIVMLLALIVFQIQQTRAIHQEKAAKGEGLPRSTMLAIGAAVIIGGAVTLIVMLKVL